MYSLYKLRVIELFMFNIKSILISTHLIVLLYNILINFRINEEYYDIIINYCQ